MITAVQISQNPSRLNRDEANFVVVVVVVVCFVLFLPRAYVPECL